MPQYCVVPQCKSHKGGHKFPDDPELCLKWQVAIKRVNPVTKGLWKPGKYSVVCHDHFVESDYRPAGLMGIRKLLKPNAVPSIFQFMTESTNTTTAERAIRVKRRRISLESSPDITSVACEEEVQTVVSGTESISNSSDLGIQCSLSLVKEVLCIKPTTMIDEVKSDDAAMQYYTGFDSFEHFMFMFNILGPAVDHLQMRQCSLNPVDQFLLVLMKMRQAKEDIDLHFLFKISESTVSNIINTWINFLYYQLKEIAIWPTKDVHDKYMPSDFKRLFRSTRVILDATEVPIQKPSNVAAQSASFSTYKNRNTLKTMIGITTRGLTSFISDSYGGSASDRQIIERSNLTKSTQLFQSGDSIMADRGIAVQDLFASMDVKVNTPHFLKGKSQLEPEEVVHDRRIASKRIHVERVIGYAKTFKILQKPLCHKKIHLGSRIIYICFMLCNFRSCIVNDMA